MARLLHYGGIVLVLSATIDAVAHLQWGWAVFLLLGLALARFAWWLMNKLEN